MMKRLIAALLVATPLAAAAAVTSVSKVPYLPVPKGAAVILNTGSTNSSGYRIVVQRGGSAEFIAGDQRAVRPVSETLVAKFFSDLHSGAPLQSIAYVPCMKSVSFGTSLFVWWNHERSPDLSCPGDDRARALQSDAQAIAAALHISSSGGTPVMRPLMPGEQHKPVPPAASPSPM